MTIGTPETDAVTTAGINMRTVDYGGRQSHTYVQSEVDTLDLIVLQEVWYYGKENSRKKTRSTLNTRLLLAKQSHPSVRYSIHLENLE